MSNHPREIPVRSYSESDLRAILSRALELDLEPKDVTISDIREIAREVGITESAVLAALQEHSASCSIVKPASQSHAWRTLLTRFGNGAILGVAATGFMSLVLNLDWPVAWAFVGAAGIFGSALALALRARGPKRHSEFQLGNLGVWSGVGLTLALAAPGAHYPGLIPWAAATGLAGALIVRIRNRWVGRRSDGVSDQSAPDAKPLAAGARQPESEAQHRQLRTHWVGPQVAVTQPAGG